MNNDQAIETEIQAKGLTAPAFADKRNITVGLRTSSVDEAWHCAHQINKLSVK